MKSTNSFRKIASGSASASRKVASIFPRQVVWSSALVLFACLCLPASAQTSEWTWMSGSTTVGQYGVYNTQGSFTAGAFREAEMAQPAGPTPAAIFGSLAGEGMTPTEHSAF